MGLSPQPPNQFLDSTTVIKPLLEEDPQPAHAVLASDRLHDVVNSETPITSKAGHPQAVGEVLLAQAPPSTHEGPTLNDPNQIGQRNNYPNNVPPPPGPPPPPPPPGGPTQQKKAHIDPNSENEVRQFYIMLRNLAKGIEPKEAKDVVKKPAKSRLSELKGHRVYFQYLNRPTNHLEAQSIIEILKARVDFASYAIIPTKLASEHKANARTVQLSALREVSAQRKKKSLSNENFACTAGALSFDSLNEQYINYCRFYSGCRRNEELPHMYRMVHDMLQKTTLKLDDLHPWLDLSDRKMNSLELSVLWYKTALILRLGNRSLQEGFVNYILASKWYPNSNDILGQVKKNCKQVLRENRNLLSKTTENNTFITEGFIDTIEEIYNEQKKNFNDKISYIMEGNMSSVDMQQLHSNFEKILELILNGSTISSSESINPMPHDIEFATITCDIDLLLMIFDKVNILKQSKDYNRKYVRCRLTRMSYFYYPQLFMQAGLFRVTGPVEDITFCDFSYTQDAFVGYCYKVLQTAMLDNGKTDRIDRVLKKINLLELLLSKKFETLFADIPPDKTQPFMVTLQKVYRERGECDEKKEYKCWIVDLSHEELDALSMPKVVVFEHANNVLQATSISSGGLKKQLRPTSSSEENENRGEINYQARSMFDKKRLRKVQREEAEVVPKSKEVNPPTVFRNLKRVLQKQPIVIKEKESNDAKSVIARRQFLLRGADMNLNTPVGGS